MSNGTDNPSFAATIHIRDHCLCLHSQRAARTLARRFDVALRPVGIRSGQFSLLTALNQPDPPTLGSIAQLLAIDRTTLTAALKPLVRDGYIVICPDREDRRSRRLVLTVTGRALLDRATPIWVATHADIEARLSQPDDLRRQLDEVLKVR